MWQVKQLEAFHAVMATGSMTSAAAGLHVSQPAVSKLIGMLEKECGFPLFTRRGNRLTATAEGELLYSEVERMMLGTKEIKRKAGEIREKSFGSLNVAAFPALSTHTLPGIVTRFCRNHPNVRVQLTGRSSVFMVNWLAAQRVDLGISVLHVDQAGFDCQRVLRMEAVCALPAGHALGRHKVLTAQQIAAEPLISLSNEDKARIMVDQFFEAANVRTRTVVETQLSESACQFVAEGAGVSIVEPLSTLGFSDQQIIVRPITPRFFFDIWLVTPTLRPTSLITLEFIEHFSVSIKEVLRNGGFYFTA